MKMNAGAPKPARVPTLTEVIEVGDTPLPPPVELQEDAEAPWERTTRFAVPVPQSVAAIAAVAPPPAAPIDEERVAERILADVQRQVGVMLEHRIRETLAPALARLTEAVVQEARVELASALRDMVARAVAQELARQRAR